MLSKKRKFNITIRVSKINVVFGGIKWKRTGAKVKLSRGVTMDRSLVLLKNT